MYTVLIPATPLPALHSLTLAPIKTNVMAVAYPEALTEVDDPAAVYQKLDLLCEPQTLAPDSECVASTHCARRTGNCSKRSYVDERFINAFKTSMIAGRLGIQYPRCTIERKRQVARVHRKMRLLRGHGLIAKIPHSQRYRITSIGMGMMNALIDLRSHTLLKELCNVH
jgi:hypothetical protein